MSDEAVGIRPEAVVAQAPQAEVLAQMRSVLTAERPTKAALKTQRKITRETIAKLMGLPAVQEQLLRDHFNQLRWWRRFRLALLLARGRL